jgi:hypothetical protein
MSCVGTSVISLHTKPNVFPVVTAMHPEAKHRCLAITFFLYDITKHHLT